VNDLQSIQYQILNYWQRKAQMPQTLTDLADPLSNYMVPNDPETNRPYEYTLKDANALMFTLCATFDLAGNETGNAAKPTPAVYNGGLQAGWDHGPGHVCFERTIDRQLYPPITPK